MSGIWALDFKPELPCEHSGGCKYQNTADWILRRPCCKQIWMLCERHKTLMQAVMEAARNYRCEHCKRTAAVKHCTWEKIKS